MRRHVTPTPLFFERAEGPYFWDADGNQLLDYTLAWGPLIVGSSHPRVNAAVSEQLARGYAFGAQHRLEARLARQMIDLVPGLEQVIFSNSGTEAIQAAMRIARAKTSRNMVVKFEGHYHGWMNNILVSYHPTAGQPTDVQPTCGGQPPAEYAGLTVLPWNDLAALEELFERCGQQIAAVITEPILANSGSCEPRPGFLEGIIRLCRDHGAVSIYDEVITGFRISRGGAREFYGVEPDLSVYGKALGAGFPLSAVGGKREMFDVLRDGRTIHAGTYNGNPICLAAASATLEILADPAVFERMHAHGRAIQTAITMAATNAGITLAVSGLGSVFSIHWGLSQAPQDYRETLRADQQSYTQFRMRMLDHGVYLLPDGRWYVGAAHDDEALRLAVGAIEACVRPY